MKLSLLISILLIIVFLNIQLLLSFISLYILVELILEILWFEKKKKKASSVKINFTNFTRVEKKNVQSLLSEEAAWNFDKLPQVMSLSGYIELWGVM